MSSHGSPPPPPPGLLPPPPPPPPPPLLRSHWSETTSQPDPLSVYKDCLFHPIIIHTSHLKMELTLGSETSAFKTQTPRNNPKDCTLHSQHGESLNSTISYKH